MSSRSAFTRLHALLIVDLMIVAIAAGGYYYVQSIPPPPGKPEFQVANLIITPPEAIVSQSIQISVNVSNIGQGAGDYFVGLMINGASRGNKTVQLSAGTSAIVEFTVTEPREGTYNVEIGNLEDSYIITSAPATTFKLNITTGPYPYIPFIINGKDYVAPYSALLTEGTYTIIMPYTDETGWDIFKYWENGNRNPTRTISLTSDMTLKATYSGGRRGNSCPSLYIWNGKGYAYAAEVSSGTGYLGILDYFRADGTIAFAYSYPWDYIKLDGNQLQPRNGYFDVKLTQKWDEIFYLDAARLVVVDHSPDVDVFSTKSTYLYNLDDQGTIYTVSKNPSPPISAINDAGEDILPQISKLDGIYTTDHEFQYDNYTLNLGDLSAAKEIKLIVAGRTLYSTGEEQGAWAAQFATQPGVKPFPPPYMEVKDVSGNWVRVPDNRQFPLLDVTPNRFVVNLTGLFPTNDYSVRIHNFFNAPFDYIGVDTTEQQDITIHTIYPSYADLHQVSTTNSTSTGNFTRYGQVTSLMREADNMFVIGRQGDEVSLQYAEIGPVPQGMERDYFVFVSCWFKVNGLPYLGFTVDPLPFHNMSVFPYPVTESYPYDADHMKYLSEYNTRDMTVP